MVSYERKGNKKGEKRRRTYLQRHILCQHCLSNSTCLRCTGDPKTQLMVQLETSLPKLSTRAARTLP